MISAPPAGSELGDPACWAGSVPGYRLVITSPGRTLSLSLADLAGLPQYDAALPITCVEEWSADARRTGVRVRDLLDLVGGTDEHVFVESLQRGGRYRASMLAPSHARDPLTLLALRLNGEPLNLDQHGHGRDRVQQAPGEGGRPTVTCSLLWPPPAPATVARPSRRRCTASEPPCARRSTPPSATACCATTPTGSSNCPHRADPRPRCGPTNGWPHGTVREGCNTSD
jgi:hypothetical protein